MVVVSRGEAALEAHLATLDLQPLGQIWLEQDFRHLRLAAEP
jgi:hypothetical protein